MPAVLFCRVSAVSADFRDSLAMDMDCQKLPERSEKSLKKEESELVTNCNRMKMRPQDASDA